MAAKPYKLDIKREVFDLLTIVNEGTDWSTGSTLTRTAWLKVRNRILELEAAGKLITD